MATVRIVSAEGVQINATINLIVLIIIIAALVKRTKDTNVACDACLKYL